MKVKVKISADQSTAAGLRTLLAKINESGLALDGDDVAVCGWLMEIAREINLASAGQMRLAGTENRGRVWP